MAQVVLEVLLALPHGHEHVRAAPLPSQVRLDANVLQEGDHAGLGSLEDDEVVVALGDEDVLPADPGVAKPVRGSPDLRE
eukprot:5227037-Alexandrium_andersonii.AAC.1